MAKTVGPGTMATINMAQNKVNILSIDTKFPFSSHLYEQIAKK